MNFEKFSKNLKILTLKALATFQNSNSRKIIECTHFWTYLAVNKSRQVLDTFCLHVDVNWQNALRIRARHSHTLFPSSRNYRGWFRVNTWFWFSWSLCILLFNGSRTQHAQSFTKSSFGAINSMTIQHLVDFFEISADFSYWKIIFNNF